MKKIQLTPEELNTIREGELCKEAQMPLFRQFIKAQTLELREAEDRRDAIFRGHGVEMENYLGSAFNKTTGEVSFFETVEEAKRFSE